VGERQTQLEAFQKFVAKNLDWFRGRLPETIEAFDRYENDLGCSFSESIKWLPTTHGYWHATGIADLEEAVKLTLECRDSIQLPARYVILNDHGDGGAIVLDTATETFDGELRIHDVDASELHGLNERDLEPDIVYETFLEYVASVLESARDSFDPEDVKYNPTCFRE